jgi:hypothetical protein
MLSTIILCIVMLSVVMLSDIILGVVMLKVMASIHDLWFQEMDYFGGHWHDDIQQDTKAFSFVFKVEHDGKILIDDHKIIV